MVRKINGVEYYGPFFETDTTKTLRQNIKAAVKAITETGARTMEGQFSGGRGAALAGTIRGEIKEARAGGGSLFGVVYSTMSVEQRPKSWVTWMERGRRRHGGQTIDYSTFKGYGMWRKTKSALRASSKIAIEQLTKGLA